MSEETVTVQRLTRVFKLGSREVLDPNPDWSPERVLEELSGRIAGLGNATLAPPRVEDGRLVYEFRKQQVQTKGRGARAKAVRPDRTDREKALDALQEWSSAQEVNTQRLDRWNAVAACVRQRMNEPSTGRGLVDPLLIPMA